MFEPSEYRRISYQTTAGTPATVSFTVPDSAAFGNTVLRVRTVTAGNIIDTADACVPFLQGESEDYTVTVASPVGISTAAGTGKLLLWPNPNNGGCEVSLAGLNGGGTLKITDALGRTVYSTSVSGSAGQYALQTHNLPKGMYLTELSGPGFVRSSLMVVQ